MCDNIWYSKKKMYYKQYVWPLFGLQEGIEMGLGVS